MKREQQTNSQLSTLEQTQLQRDDQSTKGEEGQGMSFEVQSDEPPHLLTKSVVGAAIPIFTHVTQLRHTVRRLNRNNNNPIAYSEQQQCVKKALIPKTTNSNNDSNNKIVNEKEKKSEELKESSSFLDISNSNITENDNNNNSEAYRYDAVSLHIVVYINTTPPTVSNKRQRILEEWNLCTGLSLHLEPPARQDYGNEKAVKRLRAFVPEPTLLPVATLRVRREGGNSWTDKRQMVTFVDEICILPKAYAEAAFRALLIKMEEMAYKLFNTSTIVVSDRNTDAQYNLRHRILQQNGYV